MSELLLLGTSHKTAPLALRSLREHLVIIEACRERDAQAAVKALQDHFTAALQRNIGLY